MLMAADILIAPNAKFSQPEMNIGMMTSGGGSYDGACAHGPQMECAGGHCMGHGKPCHLYYQRGRGRGRWHHCCERGSCTHQAAWCHGHCAASCYSQVIAVLGGGCAMVGPEGEDGGASVGKDDGETL